MKSSINLYPAVNKFIFRVSHWILPGDEGGIDLSDATTKDIQDTLYDLAGKIKQLHTENNLSLLRQYLSKNETTVKFSEPTSGFELILKRWGSASLKTKGGTIIMTTHHKVKLTEVDGKKHIIRSESSGLMKDGFRMWHRYISREAKYWINSL